LGRLTAELDVRFPGDAPKFLGEDVAKAIGRAAIAPMLAIIVEIVTVIERNLLAGRDVSQSDNPHVLAIELSFGIGGATMVDEPSEIGVDAAVDIELVVDLENVVISVDAALK